MEFSIKSGATRQLKTPCLVVGVFTNRGLSKAAAEVDRATRGALSRLLARGDIVGKPGECLMLPLVTGLAAERVLVVGCGKRDGVTATDFRKVVGKAAEALKSAAVRAAASALLEIEVNECALAWRVDQHLFALAQAGYRFDELKSKPEGTRLARVTLLVEDSMQGAARAAVQDTRAKIRGLELMKDLANRPGNICTPSHLAEQALALASDTLDVNVLDEAEMEVLGMGSLLSVARGSRQPAKLITLEYRGGAPDAKPIVLVGKGVTFDSGGISIKPGPGMDEMKFDMTGGACVIGALAAIADIAPPLNVIGVVPATENLPDGNASKPGDVVKSMSGQSIEILNTDAEGRLILCDALTYCARFEPDVVIDIATLTGACVIALGEHASGLMSNDDDLADALLASGQRSGDRAWRLPIWDDYQKQLDSPVADMANVGGRSAGSITAACFLARFTKNYRWAHLDIAGTAWTNGKHKGASGRPLPLLLDYILSRTGAA
jgi:leucyl aminopeptidase